MGLDGTTSHAIWAVVIVSVLGGVSVAAFKQMDELEHARDAAEALRSSRVLTRFGNATFCWYEPGEQVRFTTLNVGETTLDLADLRLMVDGAPLPVTSLSAGEVWNPSETRTLVGHAAVEPNRVALVTEQGDLVFSSKTTCPILTTILVTPGPVTLHIGDSQDFLASGYDQFNLAYPGEPYAWASAAGAVTTLTPTTARLVAGTTSGTFPMTATSGDVSGSASVTILPGAPTSIVVSPGVAGVAAGGTQAFTATAYDQYGNVNTTAPITWSTNAGSVTQGGVLTAQTTAQAGRTVTATWTSVSGSATVDVVAAAPATLDVTPDPATVVAGDDLAFTAVAYDAYGNVNSTAVVSWSTDGGSITSGGILTAQTTSATGKTVTATSGAASTVVPLDVVPDAPDTVTVMPTPTTVLAGGTRTFTATVYDQYGNVNTTAPVSWATNAGSVTSGGVLTAQTLAATGKSVTATSGGVVGTASVDVVPDQPATITVAPATVDVVAGGLRAFTATVRDQYGNLNTTATLSWSTNAGSVSASGVLTAQTTTANGRSVTAAWNAVSGSATVNVVPNQPASITVAPNPTTVVVGDLKAFTATLFDAYGNVNTTATVTWSTNAGSITSGGVLTAQTLAATGKSVTASWNAVSGSATVDVVPGAPATVTVAPNPVNVVAGATQAFTATAYDQYGNVNTTSTVSWSTNAGSVTSGGVLTAQTTTASGLGVSATANGVTQTATVNVVPGPVNTVTVSPASATVYLNRTQQFTATMRDQYGNVNTSASLSWSATSGSITQGGLYTAPSTSGSVTVTATANGKSGTASVTVSREVHVDAVATYKAGVAATTFRKGVDTVEVRVTLRDHESSLVAGASVTVEYVNSNNVVVSTQTATTSGSGVASVSYALPSNAAQNGWVARVTVVSGSGVTYNSGANVVTQASFTVTP